MPTPARARIRPMLESDLEAVAALEAATFGEEAWPRQAFADLLEAFAESPGRGEVWVAVEPRTGGLLGYAGVEVSALLGEMDLINIAVAPTARRRGVGRALLGRVLRLCRTLGVPLLWLRVRASNAGARRFYLELGFTERGRFGGYYEEPDEPAVIMAMELE
jgi:ribosomal protein S18 acetylase RimI-like enzyme